MLTVSHAAQVKTGQVGNSTVQIGKFTYGYDKMSVKQWGEGANLSIGAFCSIADQVVIMLGGNHRVDWITTFPFGKIFVDELGGAGIEGHPKTNGDVVVGNDVWIGRNSTIMSGISIGDGAVIASNSTITKNVGSYEIWGGNPAKKIGDRFDDSITEELLKICWWDHDIETIKKLAPLLSQTPNLEILNEIKIIAKNEHR